MPKYTINIDALVSLRSLAGLQAKDLAARAGISPSYLCDIEAGRRVPRPDVAKRLADKLGVPVSSFFAVESKRSERSVEVA